MARLLVICFVMAAVGCGEEAKPTPATPAAKAPPPPDAGKGKGKPVMME